MKKPLAPITPFDDRNPDKHGLYPFPLPDGVRAYAVTNGSDTKLFAADGSNLTEFVPHIVDKMQELYHAMMGEPQSGITVLGQQRYFPGVVFDMLLHDRAGTGAMKTREALDEFDFEGYPVNSNVTCALILATMPVDAFNRGQDDVDIWMRRAHLVRGLTRIGMANIYANPHPVIYPIFIAPHDWHMPWAGTAGSNAKRFWRQVENCFTNGFSGCLVVDVMQPYKVNGNAYQLINEDNLL